MNIAQGKLFARGSGSRAMPWLATGAALAVAAAFVGYKTRRAEAEHPPRGRFVEVDGVTLHYLERGQAGPAARPIVLLHGNGDLAEDFAISGLLDQLAAAGYHVIAFDRPGYGYSTRPRDRTWTPDVQADLIHHAMLRLGFENAIIVAHSWGALVALHMALDHAEAVQGLVLMSGYYYPTFRFDVAPLSLPALPVIGTLLRHTLSPLVSRLAWPLFKRRMFGPLPAHPRFDAFPVWLGLRPLQLRADAEESAMMIPAARALGKRYGELAVPIALLAGADDRHVDTRRQTQRLHEALPDSELHIVRGVGHMVYYYAQRQIVAAVDAVARRVGPRAPARQAEAVLNSAGTVGI